MDIAIDRRGSKLSVGIRGETPRGISLIEDEIDSRWQQRGNGAYVVEAHFAQRIIEKAWAWSYVVGVKPLKSKKRSRV